MVIYVFSQYFWVKEINLKIKINLQKFLIHVYLVKTYILNLIIIEIHDHFNNCYEFIII